MTAERAIILSAGLGTRLYPATNVLPKPMLPLWNVPVIEHTLRLIEGWGINECILNLHYLPNSIFRHILDRRRGRMNITLSYEPVILGTGGTVAALKWFTGSDPFWLINGDILADIDPAPLIRAYGRRNDNIASAWLTAEAGPKTVTTRNGFINDFRAGQSSAADKYTFCGLQIINPGIFKYLPASGFSTIVSGYEKAMKDGWKVAGVTVPGSYWADIGSPGSYLETHKTTATSPRLRRIFCKGQRVRSTSRIFACISEKAVVSKKASINDSVVWDNCRIGDGAELNNAIACTGVEFSGKARNILIKASDYDPALMKVVAEATGSSIDDITVMPLEARGSARSFFRIFHGVRSWILIRYSLERPENALYCRNARFLKRLGINIPGIVYDDPKGMIILMEDIGDDSLLEKSRALPHKLLIGAYRSVLRQACRMHSKAVADPALQSLPLSPAFDKSLYKWEHDLFAEHFLKNKLGLDNRTIAACTREMVPVAKEMLDLPITLVHRDFQSSNIIFKSGKPYFIDFQGMRLGAAAYDIASLLADPYVSLNAADQNELADYYAGLAGLDKSAFRTELDYAAVQRLIQATGAISRLSARPETSYFNTHLKPAVAMLLRFSERIKGLCLLKDILYSFNKEKA